MSEAADLVPGLDLLFFKKAPPLFNDRPYLIARNALRVLMMGWQDPAHWAGLISWRTFKAVFLQRDPLLLRAMRVAFQEGFYNLYHELKTKCSIEEHQQQVNFYLSNCLSVLPFADIAPHHTFKIPQCIDGVWELVEYRVVPIELTPTHGVDKLFLNDSDRVFAYGLEPMDNANAEPHLIFMGTTYPAGQGFVTQVCSDVKNETPGAWLYRSGRQRISDWLDRQSKKTHVCGMSLGGSLSLLLAMDQGEKLSRVDALNPPGLMETWFSDPYDNWDDCPAQPDVFIQKQGNDPVSAFGYWKPEWRVFHVIPPPDKQGPNGFADHALNYAGFAETQFIEIDVEQENQQRHTRNRWVYGVGRGLLYWLFMVPSRYLVLSALRVIWEHKLMLVTAVGVALLFPYLPAIPATLAVGAVAITFAAYALYKLALGGQILLGVNQVHPPQCHQSVFKLDVNDIAFDQDENGSTEPRAADNEKLTFSRFL